MRQLVQMVDHLQDTNAHSSATAVYERHSEKMVPGKLALDFSHDLMRFPVGDQKSPEVLVASFKLDAQRLDIRLRSFPAGF